jgi:HNH endonuclease
METARALTENLVSLLRREHEALADFLVALAEFDKRRLWVDLGHASFFYFLHRELGLSLGAAQHRKVAAELIQQVPAVIGPLRRGQLCLTSIIELAKVVTAENWETVLPRFYGLSRREAMEVVAELQPHPAPPLRTLVTHVRSEARSANDAPPAPAPLKDSRDAQVLSPTGVSVAGASFEPISPGEMGRSLITPESRAVTLASHADLAMSGTVALAAPPVSTPSDACAAVAPSAPFVTSAAAISPATAVPPVEVVPLTADLNRLHLTVSKTFMKKLDAVRDALSHAMPGATEADLLEAGLDLLLAQAAKRRGLVDMPQKQPRPMKGGGIPAHVRREVWKRDGGKCQFPLVSGGICGSTRQLELDHIRPRALGGASTSDNLRVVCKPHNNEAARSVLGDDLMDRYTTGLRGAKRRALRTG